jgi:hypothetical protein
MAKPFQLFMIVAISPSIGLTLVRVSSTLEHVLPPSATHIVLAREVLVWAVGN